MPLFCDTETTGKYNFKGSPEDADQPNLVQIAAILDNAAGESVGEFKFLIEPSGWSHIEPGAFDAHGISLEMAQAHGVSLLAALACFSHMVRKTDVVVCHNTQFDLAIMATAFHRVEREFPRLPAVFCTMREGTNVCKLPGWGRGKYKWPTLQEAYTILVDSTGFKGAHDAMADVRACRAVYYKLISGGVDEPPRAA